MAPLVTQITEHQLSQIKDRARVAELWNLSYYLEPSQLLELIELAEEGLHAISKI